VAPIKLTDGTCTADPSYHQCNQQQTRESRMRYLHSFWPIMNAQWLRLSLLVIAGSHPTRGK